MNDMHAALVVGYMNACNRGDVPALESSFCEDVQAYFIDAEIKFAGNGVYTISEKKS